MAIFINHSDTYRRAWLAWSLLKDMSCMRILYIYCHPLPESFHAAIRRTVLVALSDAGHQVDLLDLYAEKFDPVLSEEGRRHYHDTSRNRAGLESYIARLTSADLSDPAHVKPTLRNIKRIVGIVTYGRPRYMALWMSDPPRKIVKRYVRWFTGGQARADYYALYHLNVATDAQRAAFMAKVARAMRML